MTRSRFYLTGLLKLAVAATCLVGGIALYRSVLHPLIASAFSLSEAASSIVRRVNIFLVAVLSYLAFVRLYERRKAEELSLRRWWGIPLSGLAGAASIGITILVLYATGHYQLLSFRGFGQTPGILGLIWIAAVLEEVAFRAILFRILEERVGTRGALAGSAVIFMAVHLTNNGVSWVTLLSVTLAGLIWAGVFIVTRNLWMTAAHHCCWNAAIWATGLPLSGENWQAQAPLATAAHGSTLWTGGAFGPEDSLVNLAVSTAICVALWWWAAGGRLASRQDAGASIGVVPLG